MATMYKNRIAHLTELHRSLDKEISQFERDHPNSIDTGLTEKKKKKLALKDEIQRLTKLQWDHDHETVHFDDDDH